MDPNRKRLRWGLVIAILVVGAWAGARRLVAVWNSWGEDSSEQSVVLVANRYVPAFSVIHPGDVRERVLPKAVVPPGAITTTSQLANDKGHFIFLSAIAIPEGHPVTRAMLVDATRGEALGALIGPGQVALSLEVDRAHGVGGWIKPGDRVAVFGSTPKPRLLFPSMLVLAVDGERLGEKKEPKVENGADALASAEILNASGSRILTILVPTRAVPGFIEARDAGVIHVVLRSPGDEWSWPSEK